MHCYGYELNKLQRKIYFMSVKVTLTVINETINWFYVSIKHPHKLSKKELEFIKEKNWLDYSTSTIFMGYMGLLSYFLQWKRSDVSHWFWWRYQHKKKYSQQLFFFFANKYIFCALFVIIRCSSASKIRYEMKYLGKIN